MIGRIIRVLFGFVLACLAAGLTVVLFVYSPVELASDLASDRAAEAGLLALAAATHSAMFAAPFALIGAAIGEWQRIGGWPYYVLVGVAISAIGFLTQYWTESGSDASILNNYAVTAFLVTGVVAGIVYWLVSGRCADRGEPGRVDGEIISPVRPAPPPASPGGASARLAT
jgi:hypothetical protein